MPEISKELEELMGRAKELCTGSRMPSRNQSSATRFMQMLRGEIPYLSGEGEAETMARLKETLDEGEYK